MRLRVTNWFLLQVHMKARDQGKIPLWYYKEGKNRYMEHETKSTKKEKPHE